MRDAIFIKIENNKELVITTDCCNGVGELAQDYVKFGIEEVARLTSRVALMELLALKALPVACSLNYGGDIDKYYLAEKGLKDCFEEFGFTDIPFISSSEKNFKPIQTSVAVSITGIRKQEKYKNYQAENLLYAIVGEPLWGEEVIENSKVAINTEEFIELTRIKDVVEIIPLGSGGAAVELQKKKIKVIECDLDLNKSAGPATCVFIAAKKRAKNDLVQLYGEKLHIVYTDNLFTE